MAWTNLAEEISEELSAVGIDWREHLHLRNKSVDKEAKRQYDRWYHKQVRYPTKKAEILERMKVWREENRERLRLMQKAYDQKRKEKKLAYNRLRKKRYPESARAAQKRYEAKLRLDPERREKVLQSQRNRAAAYRARQKEMSGKKTTSSS